MERYFALTADNPVDRRTGFWDQRTPPRMARMNDVAGMHGFGPVDVHDDSQNFHNLWEARTFGINRLLLAAGIYNLDEFRDSLERMTPQHYLQASYYERWLVAIERLLVERGLLDEI